MKYLLIIPIIFITGCATPPRWLAAHYDSMDRCQVQNWQQVQPKYCGSSAGRTTIYSTPQGQPLGAPIGYTQSR